MALGDITIFEQASTQGGRGSRNYNVLASATIINAGEPVARALGGTTVTACANNAGQVGTDYVVGIAQTTSNNVSATGLPGTVVVYPLNNGTTYLIKPKVAASWDTQAEYNALVGKRVLIDLTSSSYTLLASDAAGNGCVVQPLDIAKYPGQVAFAFRAALSDLA